MQLDLLEDHFSFRDDRSHLSFTPKPFRTLHYLGSKLRMLEFIKKVADEVDPDRGALCDLFAGSGSVSQYFAGYRRIVSIDVQQYSKVICTALLKPCSDKNILLYGDHTRKSSLKRTLEEAIGLLIDYESEVLKLGERGDLESVCDFLENCSLYGAIEDFPHRSMSGLKEALNSTIRNLGHLKNRVGLASIYFGGVYFSFRQAVHLDTILYEIGRAPTRLQNTLMAALLSTASDLVNTVGKQFAQPIKPRNKNGNPKPKLITQLKKDREQCVFDTFEKWLGKYSGVKRSAKNHQILCMDYSDALDSLAESVRIVYADPPYTRDHYSRFYHGLETLCLQDYPEISQANIGGAFRLSRGLYRKDRHQSPFSIRSQAPDAFKNLFKKAAQNDNILMVSYSPYDKDANAHPRVMNLDQLRSLAEQYFKHIKLYSPGYFVHSKLNHSEKHLKASNNSELILVCRN